MKLNRTSLGTIAVATALLLAGGTAGATAGSLITSAKIKDGTIKSVDIRDETIRLRDLSPSVIRFIEAQQGTPGIDGQPGVNGRDGNSGTEGIPGATGPQGPAGPAGASQNTPHTNWHAQPGSRVTSPTSVELTGPAATSVEIEDLNVPVQAGDVVSFDVAFADGAVCTAGAPRLFLEVAGDYVNSYDDQTGCGGDTAPAADNATDGAVTFTMPRNGRIGQAGIVYDAGNPGTVKVSNVRVDGQLMRFAFAATR